ncbi:MAG: GHKL domain-containing protein [Eubacterium sp.]|nr:GHKL domain-containing protein [Eubacterium sp.]
MILMYSMLYNEKLYRKLLYAAAVLAIEGCLEALIYLSLSTFMHTFDLRSLFLSYILADAMLYVILIVTKRIFIKPVGRMLEIKIYHKIPLIIIPVCLLIFTCLSFSHEELTLTNFFFYIIMVILSLSVFFFMYEIDRAYKKEHTELMLRRENMFYKNQLELIRKSERDLSKAKHDYKNHIVSLKDYIQNNDTEGGLSYIEQILENVDDRKRIADCGNIVVDSLINYKLADCAEKGIELEINLSVPKTLFAADYDLNIILGNLLDNAAAAAEKAEEKRISITIRYYKGLLYIKTENTYSGEITEKDGRILTTKKEKHHGYGIENIREAISKYNGSLEISRTDTVFSAAIILYNK